IQEREREIRILMSSETEAIQTAREQVGEFRRLLHVLPEDSLAMAQWEAHWYDAIIQDFSVQRCAKVRQEFEEIFGVNFDRYEKTETLLFHEARLLHLKTDISERIQLIVEEAPQRFRTRIPQERLSSTLQALGKFIRKGGQQASRATTAAILDTLMTLNQQVLKKELQARSGGAMGPVGFSLIRPGPGLYQSGSIRELCDLLSLVTETCCFLLQEGSPVGGLLMGGSDPKDPTGGEGGDGPQGATETPEGPVASEGVGQGDSADVLDNRSLETQVQCERVKTSAVEGDDFLVMGTLGLVGHIKSLYEQLLDMVYKFSSVILPELMVCAWKHDPSLAACAVALASLGKGAESSGVGYIQDMIRSLESHLMKVMRDVEPPGIFECVSLIREDFQALLLSYQDPSVAQGKQQTDGTKHDSSASPTSAPSKVGLCLAALSALCDNVERNAQALITSVQSLGIPVNWRQLDVVQQAGPLQQAGGDVALSGVTQQVGEPVVRNVASLLSDVIESSLTAEPVVRNVASLLSDVIEVQGLERYSSFGGHRAAFPSEVRLKWLFCRRHLPLPSLVMLFCFCPLRELSQTLSEYGNGGGGREAPVRLKLHSPGVPLLAPAPPPVDTVVVISWSDEEVSHGASPQSVMQIVVCPGRQLIVSSEVVRRSSCPVYLVTPVERFVPALIPKSPSMVHSPRSPPGIPSLRSLSMRGALALLNDLVLHHGAIFPACRSDLKNSLRSLLPPSLREELIALAIPQGRIVDTIQLVILDVLMCPRIRFLAIHYVRPWYRSSVAQILAWNGSGLEYLKLDDSDWFKRSDPAPILPFLLTRMNALKVVTLRYVCTDNTLSVLGRACSHLEALDVSWSGDRVSDLGFRRLFLRPAPCHLPRPPTVGKRKSKRSWPKGSTVWFLCSWPSSSTRSTSSSRPLRPSESQGLLDGWNEPDDLDGDDTEPYWRESVMLQSQRNPCAKTLRYVNVIGTSISVARAERFVEEFAINPKFQLQTAPDVPESRRDVIPSPITNQRTSQILLDALFLKRILAMRQVIQGVSKCFCINANDDPGTLGSLLTPIQHLVADIAATFLIGLPTKLLAWVNVALLEHAGFDLTKVFNRMEAADTPFRLSTFASAAKHEWLSRGEMTATHVFQAASYLGEVHRILEQNIAHNSIHTEIVSLSPLQASLLHMQVSHQWCFRNHLQRVNFTGWIQPGYGQIVAHLRDTADQLSQRDSLIQSRADALVAVLSPVVQRLKWGAGANPEIQELLDLFQRESERALSQLRTVLSLKRRLAQTLLALVHLEAARSVREGANAGREGAVGHRGRSGHLFEILARVEALCLATPGSSGEKVEVSVEEDHLMTFKPLAEGEVITRPWILDCLSLLEASLNAADSEMKVQSANVETSKAKVMQLTSQVKGAVSLHHRLMWDVRGLLRALSKLDDCSAAQRYMQVYRTFCDNLSRILKVLSATLAAPHSSTTVLLPSSIEEAENTLETCVETIDEVYDGLIRLGEGGRGTVGQSKLKERSAQRKGSTTVGNDLAQMENFAPAEENTYAMSVWRRIEEKLTGRDPRRGEVLTVEKQVDLLISEARDVEKLCLLYEGWTSWV
ncbi:unnamed protein product, partial [Cyprideis torosa]